jgi:hypothetical protein
MAGKEQQQQEEIGDDEDFQMVDNASSFKNDKCPYTLKDVSGGVLYHVIRDG